MPTQLVWNQMRRGPADLVDFFINLQLLPQIFLQSLDLQEYKVPHLKDLIHFCLEPEDQEPSKTFKVLHFNLK